MIGDQRKAFRGTVESRQRYGKERRGQAEQTHLERRTKHRKDRLGSLGLDFEADRTVDCYLTESGRERHRQRSGEAKKRKRRNREEQTDCPRAEGIAVLIWRVMLPVWMARPGHCWRVTFGAGMFGKKDGGWETRIQGRELDVRQFVMVRNKLSLSYEPVHCGGSGPWRGAGNRG